MNNHIRTNRPQRPVRPKTFANAAFQQVSLERFSEAFADRNSKSAPAQVVGTIEKLKKSSGLSPSSLVNSLIIFRLEDTDALGKAVVQGV
jgi:hypothetical protein